MNDFKTVEQKIEVLKELHQNLIEQNDQTKSIQIKQVEIQIKTSQAWLSFRKNDQKNGLSLMQEAVEIERNTSKHPVTPGDVLPAIELLGDMFLEMGRNEEALAAYEENLKDRPYRFNGIYGAAIAAKQSGNQEKTLYYYRQLIELTKDSNSIRPEIEEARVFIEKETI